MPSGGGGGGQTTSTTTTQNFSPEEAAQRAIVQQEAQRIYNATAQNISGSPYPGSAPVGLSPESALARQSAYDFINNQANPQAQQAANYSSFVMGPAQYAEANPYLQSAITAATRPITQAYSGPGGALSQIRTGTQQAGQYGSTRQGIAEGIAAQGYQQAVGDTAAKMANQNYQTAQDAALKALVVAPQTQQMGLVGTQLLSGIGQQQDIINQSQNDYAAQQRMWELNAPWTPLQNYANIVFGGAAPGTSATSTAPGASRNVLGQGIGLAAQGAMIGSMVPGVGTGVGAGLGLLAGLFG